MLSDNYRLLFLFGSLAVLIDDYPLRLVPRLKICGLYSNLRVSS
jgi:hypothetical protein